MTPVRRLRSALGVVRQRTGAARAEIYVKTGNTRRIEVAPWQKPAPDDANGLQVHVSVADERGWALRAGDADRTLFLADSGPLPEPNGWKQLNRHSLRPGVLRLPPPVAGAAPAPTAEAGRTAPDDTEAGIALLRDVLQRLGERMPEARLIRGWIEIGASAAVLASTTGVTGRTALRLTTLDLHFAASRNRRLGHCRTYRAASSVRRLCADSIADDVLERLKLATAPEPPFLPAGEVAVSPALAGRLLALLAPLLRGRGGWCQLQELAADRPLGPRQLQIVDDGALDDGWLSAAVDDEGVPTRAVTLLRNGEPCEPLLTWEDDGWSGFAAAGCRRRSGWRTPPELCHSHLYIAAASESSDSIRTGIVHGCYLLDRTQDGRCHASIDTASNAADARFEIDAVGLVIRRGVATGSIPGARLTGSVRQLLQGVRAVGDDLRFLPAPGAVGAPTLLLTGLQVEAAG